MKLFPIMLLILLFPSILHSACPTATRNIYLAAVAGESDGMLFLLQVKVQPGTGKIYTAVSPLTGYSTQESEAAAVAYAFSQAGIGIRECDVFFTIKGEFSENKVDGPSAGAAMAAATLSALKDTAIRDDIVMTGTISPDGKIGEVGGVVEKAYAASDAGASYILVPRLQLYEALAISSALSGGNFRAVEVSNLSDAVRILSSGYSQEFNATFYPKSPPMPQNLAEIKYDAELGRFSIVAGRVVEELEGTLRMTGENRYSDYFANETEKYNRLILMGYPFTAANSAFLLSVDAEFLRMGDSPLDLLKITDEASSCISSLPETKKTRENFHWAVGADLRKTWARVKFNETASRKPDEREAYSFLRDMLFVKSWCQISRELSGQAGEIGGTFANESLLSQLAQEKLSSAQAALEAAETVDYDALWHYKTALEANQSGLFGAAIYDATYSQAIQKAENERQKGKAESLADEAKNLSTSQFNSLWGKIYGGQGKYISAQAADGGSLSGSAYDILKYSSELDVSSAEIDQALLNKASESDAGGEQQAGSGGPEKIAGDVAAALCMVCAASFAALAAFSLVKKN